MVTEPITVIGLEVHVQLKTTSKLFCSCSTQFGASPNTQTCPVCLGAPGALPVLNQQALALAVKTGLALNCQIEMTTRWDRKNYFYPDLPKGYQISQLDHPICFDGYLDLVDPTATLPDRRVEIERAHLEEDAGKSSHDETKNKGDSKIDLNRAGTPLLEIVTRPNMRSGDEAKTFLTELKLILANLDVSDCNMQEGSLRVDANVNLHVHQEGQVIATPIVEIKNLNSFRSVQRAIDFEQDRQWKCWKEDGLTVNQAAKQTRGWDDDAGKTVLQRTKEESADYRYFPDPDLVAIHTTTEQIEALRCNIGPLPSARRASLMANYGLNPYDASVLVHQGNQFVEFYEAIAQPLENGKLASNWIQQEVLRHLNETQTAIENFPVSTAQFLLFLKQIETKQLDNSRGKEVLQRMMDSGISLETALAQLGIESLSLQTVNDICQQLIEENPEVIQQIREGNMKAVGSLIGKAKSINRNIEPGTVRKIILEQIESR